MYQSRKTYQSKSPMKGSQYEKLTQYKQGIMKKVLYLFTHYSSLSSRYCYNQLHESYFIKLMSDIWQISGKSKDKSMKSRFEVLYSTKGKKNCMHFNQFLQLLPVIALNLNDDVSRQDSVKALLSYLTRLYERDIQNELSGRLIDIQIDIHEDTRQFIMKLAPDLLKIYKIYFPHEITNKYMGKDYHQLSFESYLTLMKQFQVFPKLITTRNLFYIFNELCDSRPSKFLHSEQGKPAFEQLGQVFKFSKFVQSFLIVSKITLFKLKQIDNEEQWDHRQKQTLKILFQYMETVKSIKKTKSKYQTERFSLVVLDDYLQQKKYRTITINNRTIREPSDKINFYHILNQIDY